MSTTNPEIERVQTALVTTLHAHWKIFLAEGIILLILGMGAIVLPPIATLAIEIIVGWLLLISGVVGFVSTFTMRHAPGFWWSLVSALAATVAGILLLRWPLTGALSLTLVLTAFLVIEGIASIMYALDHRRELSGRWGFMLFSGVVDLVLATIIFVGLPATATWAIGLLIGINLVFGGVALIGMALHARDAA